MWDFVLICADDDLVCKTVYQVYKGKQVMIKQGFNFMNTLLYYI